MEGKMFQWPFSKNRQMRIASGDRLSNRAAEAYEKAIFSQDEKSQVRFARKAARLYVKASAYYSVSGLGLASRNTLDCAAECWSLAGCEESSRECESISESMVTYWEDDGDDESD